MNQHEVTEQVALALVGAGVFDDVCIAAPVLNDGRSGPSLILTDVFDHRLSVTVEILAQP